MFKKPFSFEGRIRRTEYGLSLILYSIPAVVLSFLAEVVGGSPIFLIVYFPMFWFMIAQGAKRCHDLGNSGWFQLIPFYGLWMIFAEGDFGPNRYGLNPKGHGNEREDMLV